MPWRGDMRTSVKSPLGSNRHVVRERIAKLRFGEILTTAEKNLFVEMLLRREGALAWGYEHIGKIAPWIEPLHIVKTVPHKPWRAKEFRKSPILHEKEVEIVRERIQLGLLEHCNGPYRNPSFIVEKKTKGTYWLIVSVVKANAVTMRDAGTPHNVEGFAEAFAGYPICSLVDFFAGYEQVTLDQNSRDIMAFETPFGPMRLATMTQGATNSIAVFIRIGNKILANTSARQLRSLSTMSESEDPNTGMET